MLHGLGVREGGVLLREYALRSDATRDPQGVTRRRQCTLVRRHGTNSGGLSLRSEAALPEGNATHPVAWMSPGVIRERSPGLR